MADATKWAVKANIEAFRDQNPATWTRWLFEDVASIVSGDGGQQLQAAAD